MTKPTRLAAKTNRAAHERPTRPAPAYAACRAAAEREALRAAWHSTAPRSGLTPLAQRSRFDRTDGLRATLSIDPVTQAELLTLSAALTAPKVPSFDRDAIEFEVDSLFADLGVE